MSKNKKLSLVISGGGSRVFFALGIIKYFEEKKIEFDSYSGSSAGALLCAYLSIGFKSEEIFDLFKDIKLKDILTFNLLNGSIFKFRNDSPIFLPLKEKKIENLPKSLNICVVNLNNGKIEYKNEGDLELYCKASLSLYPLLEPTLINKTLYIDGGFMNNLPIEPIKDSKTIAVNLNPITSINNKKLSFYKTIKRVIYLMFYANIEVRSKVADIYLEPKSASSYNILNTKCFAECFEKGYYFCKENFSLFWYNTAF